jgi:hypothetical protein
MFLVSEGAVKDLDEVAGLVSAAVSIVCIDYDMVR